MMAGLLVMGCSVDDTETKSIIQSFDVSVETCEPKVFEIYDKSSNLGQVSVSNSSQTDSEILIEANTDYTITSVRWGSASNSSGLPQNGSGIKVNDLTKVDYTNKSSIVLNVIGQTSFAFAALVEFKNSTGGKVTSWIGDKALGKNGSMYFLYETCTTSEDPCKYLSGGSVPEERRISRDFVRENLKYSWQVEEYLLGMLDEGVSTDGEFSPTVDEIIQSYRANPFQTFITTYTITDGECEISIDLTLTVAVYHDYQL